MSSPRSWLDDAAAAGASSTSSSSAAAWIMLRRIDDSRLLSGVFCTYHDGKLAASRITY